MADNMAQQQTEQGQSQGTGLQMPKLDYASLNKFMQEQNKNAGTQSQKPAEQAQQSLINSSEQTSQSPQEATPEESAEPQNKFANIKDGDTFTDENGQQWQYTVMNFSVVPEDVKDEMVDDITGTQEDDLVSDDAQDDSDIEAGEEPEYDENIERGLDIALSILREEDESDAGITQDSALDILMSACDEVIGTPTQDTWTSTTHKELDGQRPPTQRMDGYNKGQNLTYKQDKYTVGSLSEIPLNLRKKGKYKQVGENEYEVQSYLPDAQKKAKEKAHKSQRFGVAAKFEDCKAKDPYKCRFHGAMFMRDNFGKILEANGLPPTNFEVMIDPEQKNIDKKGPIPYRLVFATPKDASDDIRRKCAREFFMKHPELVYELPKSEAVGDLRFSVKQPEDIDDLPVDAPSWEDYQGRFETSREASYGEGNNVKGAESYTKYEKLSTGQWFDILSEFPRNIVELNEDMVRYLHNFPECVPEGMSMEDVQDLYARFKKANAAKKGTQAYIMNGEVTDRAEALAKAAEQGYEKEAKEYYDVSKEVYDIAAQVFNNVQQQLQDAYEEVNDAIRDLPGEKVVSGSSSGFKNTYYFGDAFKSKAQKFPLNIGKNPEVQELMNSSISLYCSALRQALMIPDKIMLGCKSREPVLVRQGIAAARCHLQKLRELSKELGAFQDDIISAKSDVWRKKNGISLPAAKGNKKNSSVEVSTTTERPQEIKAKAEKVKARSLDKTGQNEPAKGEAQSQQTDIAGRDSKSNTGTIASGISTAGGSSTPVNQGGKQLTDAIKKQIQEEALNDKNINALIQFRRKMFKTFGADSEQYKTADKKAREASLAFAKKRFEEITANTASSTSENPNVSSNKKAETSNGELAQNSDVKTEEPKQAEQQQQQPKKQKQQQQQQTTTESAQNTQNTALLQNSTVSKPTKRKSSVVQAAEGNQQQSENAEQAAKVQEPAVEASGEGLDIVRGMKISDKPTLEEAKAMNEQFSALEERLRGLTQVYQSKTSDSQDWKSAEAELKAIKAELDNLMMKARGKGYQWTKDSPRYGMEGASDRRPLDIPTNFHLSGIKDESGRTINVPYQPPSAAATGKKDKKSKTSQQTQEEGSAETTKAATKKTTTFKKKADYSADFDSIEDKVGLIGKSPYKDKSIFDLISDGYEVKPVTKGKELAYYLGVPDAKSTYGVRFSKEQPAIPLRDLFIKRMGGNPDDEQAYHDFLEALRWKVKDYRDLL